MQSGFFGVEATASLLSARPEKTLVAVATKRKEREKKSSSWPAIEKKAKKDFTLSIVGWLELVVVVVGDIYLAVWSERDGVKTLGK